MVGGSDLDEKLKRAYETISSLSVKAYNDVYLISNQVLSKNPYSTKFLNNFLTDKTVQSQKLHKVVYKLIRYYVYSLIHYIIYIVKYLVYCIEGSRFQAFEADAELIIIDTFFLSDNIIKSNGFMEMYFQGLDRVLDMTGKRYAYLPVFYGSNSPFVFHSVIKLLKKERIPVLSEYQLLSLIDLLRLFIFIVAYPLHLLRYVTTLDVSDNGTRLAKHEMIETLDEVTFPNFSRYLQGRQIAKLPCKKIKLISWYENQVIDKYLYKGVKANRGRVIVYGAQLFLFSKMDFNILADEKEYKFDVIPDKIIVNGPFYVPASSSFHYVTGPSLRYGDLFRLSVEKERQRDILVLLSYSGEDTENILRMLTESNLSSRRVIIKNHPATPINEFSNLVHPNWTIANEETYRLFETAKMVIGSNSGSLVEAASLGIPVIRIINHRGIDYNILPELGKGILWDETGDAEELMLLVEKYENMPDHDLDKIAEISTVYKKLFFCEPTHEKIMETFDIK